MISPGESVRDSLRCVAACVIDNLYGDKNGSHGASMGWVIVYAGCLRKQISIKGIEVE